jgi:nucleoside-diphosphate-sugar epimerase
MAIKNVTLLGADGRLGPAVLTALLAANFKVQVLKRESSKSTSSYPPGVSETRVPDDFPSSALEKALQGQDATVITIPGSNIDLQKKLADAAVKAGVQRFIPADFGSVDSDSDRAKEWVPLYVDKYNLRQYLQSLATQNSGFSWTALVCGHFFDYDPLFLHIDVKARKADILDEGDIKASASTMKRIGEATARILEKAGDEKTKNRTLYVQSFCATQVEVIKAFEKATGQEFKIRKIDGATFAKEEIAKSRTGDKRATEDVVWVLGAIEANWEKKDGFANGLLGLEEEYLDEVVRTIVEEDSPRRMSP